MSLRKYPYYLSSIGKLLAGMKPFPQIAQVFLRRTSPENLVIELRKNGTRFKVRGVMDIWSVKETFLDRFYEKCGTPIKDGWKILDIGGGIGDFTIFCMLGHPRNRVYAFEPTPESFGLLTENLKLNRIKGVRAFSEAVWSQAGSLAIDMSAGEPGQFISRQINAPSPADGKVIVPSIPLEEVFTRLQLKQCDLMKMDCEGAEYPILFSTPDSILERIKRVVMEFHDNVTEFTHQDLVNFFSSKGFNVKTYDSPVHGYLGYLYAEREPFSAS